MSERPRMVRLSDIVDRTPIGLAWLALRDRLEAPGPDGDECRRRLDNYFRDRGLHLIDLQVVSPVPGVIERGTWLRGDARLLLLPGDGGVS